MLSGRVLVLTCVLLLLTHCPNIQSRRAGRTGGRRGGAGNAGIGGGRGGALKRFGVGGGVQQYKAPYVRGRSPSSGSNARKIAGAAAAGALGGMVVGHGLGSLSRPGYSHGHAWNGGYDAYPPGYGGGQGHPRYAGENGHGLVRHGGAADRAFRKKSDMEYYSGAASRGHKYSCVLLFGTTVWFLSECWVT